MCIDIFVAGVVPWRKAGDGCAPGADVAIDKCRTGVCNRGSRQGTVVVGGSEIYLVL